MDNSKGSSKLVGRAGSVMAALGVLLFFVGIFGGPRVLAFAGLGLMAAALVGFYLEELSHRRAVGR